MVCVVTVYTHKKTAFPQRRRRISIPSAASCWMTCWNLVSKGTVVALVEIWRDTTFLGRTCGGVAGATFLAAVLVAVALVATQRRVVDTRAARRMLLIADVLIILVFVWIFCYRLLGWSLLVFYEQTDSGMMMDAVASVSLPPSKTERHGRVNRSIALCEVVFWRGSLSRDRNFGYILPSCFFHYSKYDSPHLSPYQEWNVLNKSQKSKKDFLFRDFVDLRWSTRLRGSYVVVALENVLWVMDRHTTSPNLYADDFTFSTETGTTIECDFAIPKSLEITRYWW